MKVLVSYFKLLVPAFVLVGCTIGLLDLVRADLFGNPPVVSSSAMLTYMVAGTIAALVGLLISLAFVFPLTAYHLLRARRRDTTAEAVLDRFFGLGVAPSGAGWRMWAATALVVACAIGSVRTANYITSLTSLTNVLLVIAHSVWITAGAVAPAFVLRFVAVKWPAWAPNRVFLWAFLALWAYYVTVNYWAGASETTLWASLPLYFIPGAAAVYYAVARGRKIAELTALVTVLAAIGVVAAYPDRWLPHSQISSGALVSSGAWRVLQTLSDLDGDGASHLLGGLDCDGTSYEVRPFAVEIPGDGVDNNCFGGDLSSNALSLPGVPKAPEWQLDRKPPVIVLTVDTLRRDALHRTVDGKEVSPVMDALVDGATHFTNAYSTAAGTDESIPALFSGMYPSDWHQHGVYFGVESTLAHLLTEVGYQSQAVILMPWLQASLIYGFQYLNNSLGERHYRETGWLSSASITDLALSRLDAADPARPQLLWVHYFDVHEPRQTLVAEDEWLGEDPYLQRVRIVDAEVGRFLKGLDERGLLDEAVIVFASDHGEALGEHGLITHGWGIWESIVRIPLAIRMPGIAPRKIDIPVSLVDVLPTLLDYLRLEDGVTRDGRTLLPAALGRPVEPRPIFIEAELQKSLTFLGVVDENLKFFIDLRKGAYHLYDIEADPLEAHNLIGERPSEADRLMGVLGEWRDMMFNEARLERKRQLWPERSKWRPQEFITADSTLEDADAPMTGD